MFEMPEIMSEEELSKFVGIPPRSLAQDRYLGKGIPYVKFGQRVRYLRDDVIAFMLANRKEVGKSA
ncbi:helix-turn-helix domain-containing protein [Mycobacterium sp. M1]|uniref:Helix-turn-helix domain-containing protein n=1 Tax=Mycolicibacter acidiphilus TaxID=2835306 RepID=A0ABS5RNA3_9MYCO|nr:DNA-binding protein [Mycolicibacter acidiphilus]MBS9535044.1 helix-turn-helix domain-containing protein [Mycolicibacter acidiphilus]